MDVSHCPECGAGLEEGLSPSGLCAQCLLKLGLDDPTDQPDTDTASSDSTPSLAPGQEFGPYQIIRLLNKGGMGEVYEAEHSDSGRRIALKVIGHRLTSEKKIEGVSCVKAGWPLPSTTPTVSTSTGLKRSKVFRL